MNITIRNAVAADCEKIRPLQAEIAALHHNGRPDIFKTEPRYFPQEVFDGRLSDPLHFIFIAESDGEVVGYAFAWIIQFRNHPTYIDFDKLYIDDICVRESCHRQGIGRKLFEKCRQTAVESGCKTMDLGVWSFNESAIAFYENMGMTECTRKMELCL